MILKKDIYWLDEYHRPAVFIENGVRTVRVALPAGADVTITGDANARGYVTCFFSAKDAEGKTIVKQGKVHLKTYEEAIK